MINKLQQQPLHVTSLDWSPIFNYLSHQAGNLEAFIEQANSESANLSELIACVRRDKDGEVHIRMPALCGHPLYICEYQGQAYISDHIVDFYHLGKTCIDENYLSEVAHFGFTTQHKTLLKNVRPLFASEQYSFKNKQLVWLNQSRKSEVKESSTEHTASHAPFDNIPSLALNLFSPVDHSLYLNFWCYLQATDKTELMINELELRSSLEISKRDFISANGPLAKKANGNTRKQENNLKQKWQQSGLDISFQDYLWQQYQLPFVQSLLTTLAYRHNKRLVFCQDSQVTMPWNGQVSFNENDSPIHNLFEAFQRLFFYGNKWLVKRWLFIPPLISAKLIGKRKGNGQRLFLYATSLDYLMRFHTLNHDTSSE